MYVTYDEYKELKYNIVPESDFPRYEAMAENYVRKYTQNRITDADLHPTDPDAETRRVVEMNMRGVCELVDEFFVTSNPNSAAAKSRRTINSFSNGDYSENYGSPRYETANTEQTKDPKRDILDTYFTDEQLWRGFG